MITVWWAEVPRPLYDELEAVIVLPLELDETAAAAAVARLLDERRFGDVPAEAGERPLAS